MIENEVSSMFENFDVGVVYPLRTYERHQFSFSIDGKVYKGDFHGEEINWLHPHPKQYVGDEQLNQIEDEVHKMLGHHGVTDNIEDIEIERMLNKHHSPTDAHRFKLRTEEGEEFKGVFRDEDIEWFHPKPEGKLNHDKIEELEKNVQQKVIEHKGKEV